MAGIKLKKEKEKRGTRITKFLISKTIQIPEISSIRQSTCSTTNPNIYLETQKITPLMHRIKNRNKYECFSYYTLFCFQNTQVKKQNENAWYLQVILNPQGMKKKIQLASLILPLSTRIWYQHSFTFKFDKS